PDARPKSPQEKLGVEKPDNSSENAPFAVNDTHISSEEGGGQFESFDIYDDYIGKKIERYQQGNRLKADGTLKLTLAERAEAKAKKASNAVRKLVCNPEQTGAIFTAMGQEWLYGIYTVAIMARGVGAGTRQWGGVGKVLGTEINA